MKRITFLLLMGFLWSCQSSDANQEEPTNVTIDHTNRDSIRQVYAKRMAERTKSFPAKQVLEVGKINPVDEAPLDTTFFLLREDLREAVEQRDIFFVLSIVDENVKCSFGAEEGMSGFVQMWGLDTPEKTKNSPLWAVLEKLLEQGGAFSANGNRFTMPYLFATFPDDYDAFEYGAVLGSGVRMREMPNLNSKIAKVVSYDILKIIEKTAEESTIGGETHPWIKVELLDGTAGYIYGKFVGSPIDFRAIFERTPTEGWKMTVLVAGD
jgi:hypothetical protein